MPDPVAPHQLLSDEDLDRLAERVRLSAIAGVNGEPADDDDDEDDTLADGDARFAREHASIARALYAARFVAAARLARREASGLFPIEVAGWALGAATNMEHRIDHEDVIASAVESCAPRLDEIPGLAERLMRSPLVTVRLALAQHLPDGHRIIGALVADVDAGVRHAATKRLGTRAQDAAFPIATDGHREKILAPARALMLEASYRVVDKPRRAVRAFAPLSDALAIACWERLLSGESVYEASAIPWIAALLRRPRSTSVLWTRVPAWIVRTNRYAVAKWCTEAVKRLPAHVRTRVHRELQALGAHRGDGDLDLRIVAAALLVKTAPARGHADRALEDLLGGPFAGAAERGGAHWELDKTLAELVVRWPLSPRARRALRDARRAGKPGRWKSIPVKVYARLPHDPRWRSSLHRALATVSEDDAHEALADVLGQARDPSRDGSVGRLARRLWARPALRRALMQLAGTHVRALAREAILSESLDAAGLGAALQIPGIARRAPRVWPAARRRRDALLTESDAIAGLAMVEDGPRWHPADLAHAEAALAVLLADPEPGIYFWILRLAEKPGAQSDALMDLVRARLSEAERTQWDASLLREIERAEQKARKTRALRARKRRRKAARRA